MSSGRSATSIAAPRWNASRRAATRSSTWRADYRLWIPDPPAIYRTNVDGSRDLLRAAADAGATRIVYTSSVATLGLNAVTVRRPTRRRP